MIKIVTVERETDAAAVKSLSGFRSVLTGKLWDHQLTEEIARLAKCSKDVVEQREEPTDPLYYRLFKSFLRGSYEGSINAHKLNLVDAENILKWTERVVLHSAGKGNCVIVGRGSQLFLKDREDTFRVFLYAPREDKVRRLLSRGKTEQEAYELVDTVDRERKGFIEKYFHVQWPDRAVYHAMINTAIGDETVVQTVMNIMKTFDSKFDDSKSDKQT